MNVIGKEWRENVVSMEINHPVRQAVSVAYKPTVAVLL
jgi:hypothetical protein